MGHRGDGVAQGGRVARHLERHVEALDHVQLGEGVRKRALGRVDDQRRAHLPGELSTEGVGLADHHVAGAGMARDGGGHQPDRAGSGHQDVLTEDREGQRRVHRIAERVEDRGDLLVDAGPVVPHVGHRQGHVLGERSVAPDPEPDRLGAQVAPPGQAVAAAAADHVTLARHEVAGGEVGDVGAHVHDLADELVTDHERRLDRPGRPRIPALDVEVRAADPGLVDADQDVVDADRGDRHLAQLQTRTGSGLDQGQHRAGPVRLVALRVSRCPRSSQ